MRAYDNWSDFDLFSGPGGGRLGSSAHYRNNRAPQTP